MHPTASQASDARPHIGILLATYNGADCLQEQLDSLDAQSHTDWQLLVSDDGSTDETLNILDNFGASHPVTIFKGRGNGAAANFMSLLARAEDNLPAGSWIAFCDQDDVWLSDKLARSVAAVSDEITEGPALYCSRTWVVDENLKGRTLSAARPRPPSFLNALAQNIAAGNTILLNGAAARLAMEAARETSDVVMHDWWAYQIVTGAGGLVVHDDTPTLLYRQHAGNEVGANNGLRAKLNRLMRMIRGDFKEWNDINVIALAASRHRFTPQAQADLDRFTKLRKAPLLRRLSELKDLGIYRQSKASNVALFVAAFIRRL
ncbi:glycosyltransferase involved in cell wall biosynthesis [Shimia isoporae]|uniref:Glycosyltransferase involved in cell wall biosynthesis n=1 Tax=Shimia isoporae TaxID=647720 RepID=A0A4V2Q1Y3_9RHOB|nr:glycosyltransferase family 2 protein [Shimia isoporae]TCK99872.1 glycosyltransferase involved in cell wall biosynthesis [Shimia isoporae]